MSVDIDTLEDVFDNEEMPEPPAPSVAAVAQARADLDRVRQLRARIGGMERTRVDSGGWPCAPEFAELLPALQPGTVCSVVGSLSLAMALVAAPVRAGAWCGVVATPGFGVEAAARLGVDLSRLVLVPHPGQRWFAVTAALADALPIVIATPAGRLPASEAERFAARLRQRGSVLLSLGEWARSDTRLSVVGSAWSGVGEGWGYPRSREITVAVSGRDGRRSRLVDLCLQAGGSPVTPARAVAPAGAVGPAAAPAIEAAS